MLAGDPRWTHRRRLVYAIVTLSFIMIVVAMADLTDRQVSSQLTIGAVSLLSIVMTAYVGFATFDDRWQKADHEPSDLHPPHSRTDGDGMAR